MKNLFREALYNNSIADLHKIPKSDLHNHAGRGGRIEYIEEWAKVKIKIPAGPFETLDQMQEWFDNNVKCHCTGIQGYLKRIEAAFAQAQMDNIKVLSLSFGIGEMDLLGGIGSFTDTMDALKQCYAPDTAFFPELALGRESNIGSVLNRLDEILSYGWFKSVDICNNEFAQPIRNFKPIYRCAKASGLRLKAHVGEFGTADDLLIFNQDISQEYFNLYNCNLMTVDELNEIREKGLNHSYT